jgi:hypothetical protein
MIVYSGNGSLALMVFVFIFLAIFIIVLNIVIKLQGTILKLLKTNQISKQLRGLGKGQRV